MVWHVRPQAENDNNNRKRIKRHPSVGPSEWLLDGLSGFVLVCSFLFLDVFVPGSMNQMTHLKSTHSIIFSELVMASMITHRLNYVNTTIYNLLTTDNDFTRACQCLGATHPPNCSHLPGMVNNCYCCYYCCSSIVYKVLLIRPKTSHVTRCSSCQLAVQDRTRHDVVALVSMNEQTWGRKGPLLKEYCTIFVLKRTREATGSPECISFLISPSKLMKPTSWTNCLVYSRVCVCFFTLAGDPWVCVFISLPPPVGHLCVCIWIACVT